jgi:glycosyltransferase involved in cell wall biosynthesis
MAAWPVAVLGPFHPYRGGIAHHTTLLATTLAHRHTVLGLNFTRLYPGVFFPGRTQYDESDAPLRASDVRVVRVVDSIGPHTWWRCAAEVQRAACRLLIVQWWHPFFAPAYRVVATLVRRAGVRVLFLCHNVLPHESSRLDGALIRFGLAAADAFLLQSDTDRDALERLLPGRPYAVTPHPAYTFFAHGGIDREAARERLQVEGPVVLFFGLVRAYKGLDVLLRAVARARERVPLQLLVAGEFYEDRAPYERLLDDLQIRAAVRLVDRYIPNEEVEAYFRAADVVVLPYRSATQSGIVQIALSFERPVVVTRVGGLPEAVRPGQTGEVVPPADPEALAATLVRFFESDAGRRMQPHLRGAVRDFSWEAMEDTVHRLANQLGLP